MVRLIFFNYRKFVQPKTKGKICMYLLDISVSMQFPTLLAEKGNYQKLRFLQ